ncbi:MAG: protein kinase [Kofleriaceae bacterium]|nr:protein kinase [Kofleriaceae bacterium]
MSERDDASAITSAGTILGTPYYMSPEQIRAEDVDHRADIYSFGALMFRLLTGENAFNAKTPVGVLTKHLTEPLTAPSLTFPELDIPPEVDAIILKCLAKNPDDRYPSVRELLQDIENLYMDLQTGSSTSDVRQPPTEWLATATGKNAPVAALLEDELDHGMDVQMRLRRGDLDDFESKLKRNRLVRLIFIPMLVLGMLGGASYFLLFRPEKPHTVEVNPNNELGQATLIAGNTEVSGYIGARVSKTKADQDFFRFNSPVNRDGSEVVSVKVTAPPNIDISIDLYDTSGTLLNHSDEAGVGENESLRRWRINGPIVVAVSGVRDGNDFPTENVSDPYVLKVMFLPADTRLESEPNDSRADANSLSPGSPLSGYLDRKNDKDVYRLFEAEGEYRLLISGSDELPVEWRLDVGEWKSSLTTELTLDKSSTITIRRSPLDESGQDIAYTIDVSPR